MQRKNKQTPLRKKQQAEKRLAQQQQSVGTNHDLLSMKAHDLDMTIEEYKESIIRSSNLIDIEQHFLALD
jgi:hypothetical protein